MANNKFQVSNNIKFVKKDKTYFKVHPKNLKKVPREQGLIQFTFPFNLIAKRKWIQDKYFCWYKEGMKTSYWHNILGNSSSWTKEGKLKFYQPSHLGFCWPV